MKLKIIVFPILLIALIISNALSQVSNCPLSTKMGNDDAIKDHSRWPWFVAGFVSSPIILIGPLIVDGVARGSVVFPQKNMPLNDDLAPDCYRQGYKEKSLEIKESGLNWGAGIGTAIIFGFFLYSLFTVGMSV